MLVDLVDSLSTTSLNSLNGGAFRRFFGDLSILSVSKDLQASKNPFKINAYRVSILSAPTGERRRRQAARRLPFGQAKTAKENRHTSCGRHFDAERHGRAAPGAEE
jgi:hypothetical protein